MERQFDFGVLGMTVPQKSCFYGLPWLTAMAGLGHIGGPTVSQACATSARAMATATREIQAGLAQCALVITADRISNGPHIYYPDPLGPGGTGATEDWVMSNFNQDPYAQVRYDPHRGELCGQMEGIDRRAARGGPAPL